MLGVLPLPGGERVGVRGSEAHRETITPHPTPLPMGEGAERVRGTHFGIGRRAFMSLLTAGAAWPLVARAQQERMRHIGVLLPAVADDPVWQARLAAFYQGLALLGWTIGRNVRIDTHWATTNSAEIRRHAVELAALAPDIVLTYGTSIMGSWRQATRTVPTVFIAIADPVGGGFADSMARPGGNATGFMAYEWSISGKWLELLKQIAPSVKRAAATEPSKQPISRPLQPI